ncbi:MAG: ankyrin repeat domain-containing protein [Puniceicoccales bacterium]|jgi:hypothetical protein|nr:ankyrin repeat domain-containing protein [Puniceicoccales bacterium]
MRNAKKEISYLLMAFVSSVAMGCGERPQKSRNEVPIASAVSGGKKDESDRPSDGEEKEEDAIEKSRRLLFDFLDEWENAPTETMRLKDIVAAIRENCENFRPCLERFVKEFPDLRPLDQSALLTIFIVMGEWELMGKIVAIKKVSLSNDAVFGWVPAYYAVFLNSFDDLRFCINRGTPANVSGDGGRTLLMAAIRQDNLPMVRFLLTCKDVGIEIRDAHGLSALDYAGKCCNREIFLSVKAAVNAKREDLEYDAEEDPKDRGSSESSEFLDEEYDAEDTEESSAWNEEEEGGDDGEESEKTSRGSSVRKGVVNPRESKKKVVKFVRGETGNTSPEKN